MRLGLLMETAHAQQKLVEARIGKLEEAAAGLVAMLREEVHRALAEEIRALSSHSRNSADALESLQRSVGVRVAFWSASVTAMCAGVSLALAWWLVPAPSYIRSLRAQRDQLAEQVAALRRNGGLIELRRCGERGRLCVRVDRGAPSYGASSDYLVIKGY